MGGKILKFKKSPKFEHQRSEGTTRRGQKRQERLMRGPKASQASLDVVIQLEQAAARFLFAHLGEETA